MKNRRPLIVHLLLTAIVVVALLPAAAAAQQPTATTTPQPASTTSTPAQSAAGDDEVLAGNYEVISNIEFGVRGLGIDGSRLKYYSDRNYRSGFRVFDSSFLIRSKDHTGPLLDTMLVTSAGWGGDPDGSLRINAEKSRWYKFDANFRRNAYDNYIACCNFAQARAAGPNLGLGVGQNFVHTKHKFGDLDLKLLPLNRNIRFNLGYSGDRSRGPSGSSLSYAREDLATVRDWRSRSDEVRGGLEARAGKLDLAFTQGYRFYRDDTSYSSGPNSGNNLTNFSVINSYLRLQPMRGRAWYSRLSAHTQLAERFDITARYTYTKSVSRFTFTERATGLGYLENQNLRIDENLVTAAGDDIERPTHLFDLGLTWKATERLRISNTFRANRFSVDGTLAYSDVRFLRRTTGAQINPYPIVLNLNPFRELAVRRWQNNLEFDYDFGPRLSVFLGHRYIDRRQEEVARQRVYPLNSGANFTQAAAFASESHAENSTNGFFGGFKAQPVKGWNIWFDANRGQSDNAFTRIDNYDTLSFRFRNRITPRRGLNFNASIITRDNDNPGVADESLLGVPEFDVDISSRTFTSSVDWSSHSRVYLNAGYTYQHLTSDVGIIYFAPVGTPPVTRGLTGRNQYYLRDHYFFFNASVQPHSRVTLYASYNGHHDTGQGDRVNNDAAGQFIRSYPLRFQSPEARVVFKLGRRVDWSVGYQYFDYKEKFKNLFPDLYVNQNYRAHLPYTSLRIYFGRNDR